MTSSIDANVFIALWDTAAQHDVAEQVLNESLSAGQVVVCGPVYAELLGGYQRTTSMLDTFFTETGIAIDWTFDRQTWELAGLAYQAYGARRRRQKSGAPRRLLTDFLIGAHASRHRHRFVTQDTRLYRAAFPTLHLVHV